MAEAFNKIKRDVISAVNFLTAINMLTKAVKRHTTTWPKYESTYISIQKINEK